MPSIRHHNSSRLTPLDRFCADYATRCRKGLQLKEFVREALAQGFRGEHTGELTEKVHSSLRKLVRRGVLQRDESLKVQIA